MSGDIGKKNVFTDKRKRKLRSEYCRSSAGKSKISQKKPNPVAAGFHLPPPPLEKNADPGDFPTPPPWLLYRRNRLFSDTIILFASLARLLGIFISYFQSLNKYRPTFFCDIPHPFVFIFLFSTQFLYEYRRCPGPVP